MLDRIFPRRRSFNNQIPLDEGVRDASVGDYSPENLGISYEEPPLTLSQRLQRTRSEQQEQENQRKAELDKRNMDVITKFIVEHVEPLLKEQAIAGLSKTFYMIIPSGTDQKDLTQIMPGNKNIVEGFGGSKTAGAFISTFNTKEYAKVIRLVRQEYSLKFWQQPTVMKELEQTLKLRLQASGEKLAETTPNSAGREWRARSFIDGETLPAGYTGVQLQLHPSKSYPRVTFIEFYAEIA